MPVHIYPVCRLFSQTLNELHDIFTINNNLSYQPVTLFLLLKAPHSRHIVSLIPVRTMKHAT